MPPARITVVIEELPPSANRLWRFVPGRRPMKSLEYRGWLSRTGLYVRTLVKEKHDLPPKKPWGLFVIAEGLTRRRDLDNIIKPICDMLSYSGIVPDDRWLDFINVRAMRRSGNPRLELHIYDQLPR